MTTGDPAAWFTTHLQASADGLVWGVEQVPPARRVIRPPGPHDGPSPLGEWTVARHVFHMLYYEQHCALPSMRQWLHEPMPSMNAYDEDGAWDPSQSIDELISGFQRVRAAQIALIPRFAPAAWDETRDAVWGPVTLRWVVSKTYQHTAEHTNDILRIALFWD
jgi:hypothetical protein